MFFFLCLQHRLQLIPVSHGRKLRVLDVEVPQEEWFQQNMVATGLEDLAKTGHLFLDPYLIRLFVERRHGDTFSFHMPVGEITVTLDDVSCLLYLPIAGLLLDHQPHSPKTKVLC
jgi:hypothetical protein